jgi:competence protein ComEA
MKFVKPSIANIYKSHIKLLPLFICYLLNGCGAGNQPPQIFSTGNTLAVSEKAININQATVEEFEKLPGVGEKLARDIVEHRAKFGSFRKTEHLLLIDGISDKHYREIKNMVKVE